MLGKLKEFHQKTMAAYQKGIDDEMEDWKKRLRDIHNQVEFLFYIEQLEFEKIKGKCIIRGELVRGFLQAQDPIIFLDQEGEIFAEAFLLGDIAEETEETKKVAKKKRNEFLAQFSRIRGFSMEDIDEESYDRLMKIMAKRLSFAVDQETMQTCFQKDNSQKD